MEQKIIRFLLSFRNMGRLVLMKKQNIRYFIPYERDYSQLIECKKYETVCLCIISLFSVSFPVLDYYFSSTLFKFKEIFTILNLIYFLLIVIYYILNIYTEIFLYPALNRKRRKGFIDNSLGSKFLEKSIEGYYTNNKLPPGPYKMIINCAENCYFTKCIARAMIPQMVMKNVVVGVLFLIIAYIGIKGNLIAIPILQVLFSTLFFTNLIYYINFVGKLDHLFERFETFFINKPDESKILQDAVLFCLDYETTLAYNKIFLSNNVYEKLNEQLSNEWKEIKDRYEIQ